MLSSTSPSEFFFAWIIVRPSFPLYAPALATSFLPRCGTRHLDSLPSHDLVIWTDGSVFFLSGKSGSGVLANCSFCGPEATFFHLVGSVCSSLSAEARAILQALCWSRQQQQVCHFSSLFLLSNCHLVLATLIYFPSFFLRQTLWQIWQELSSLSFFTIRLQWIPDQSFLTANEAADELTRRVVLVVLSAIFCSLSPLISSVHSFSGVEAYCLI